MNVFGLSFILFYLYLKAGLQFSIHNNKWQCNSFFCTEKETFWDFEMQKKIFFVYVRNLEPSPPPLPTPLVRNCAHLAWSLHSFFVSTYYVDDPLISPRIGGGGLIIFQGFKLRRLLESSTEKKDAPISESEELFTVTFKT